MITNEDISVLFTDNMDLFINSAQEFSNGQQSAVITIDPESKKICIADINNSPKTVYENIGYSECFNCIETMKRFMNNNALNVFPDDYTLFIQQFVLPDYLSDGKTVTGVDFILDIPADETAYHIIQCKDELPEEYIQIYENWYVYSFTQSRNDAKVDILTPALIVGLPIAVLSAVLIIKKRKTDRVPQE